MRKLSVHLFASLIWLAMALAAAFVVGIFAPTKRADAFLVTAALWLVIHWRASVRLDQRERSRRESR